MSEWTEEQVNLASSLWIAGETSAEKIGAIVDKTKNSVIGKMHRLGVKRGGETAVEEPEVVAEVVEVAPEPEPIPEPEPEPEPEPVPEPDLLPGTPFLTATRCCKFPLWGHHEKISIYNKRVCGGRLRGKDKWCEEHKPVVYEPLRPRR